MATRKIVTEVPDNDMLVKLFVMLEDFDSTEANPTKTDDVAEELGEDIQTTFNMLNTLADAELIDGERGEWWISVPDISAENAESTAREALNGSVAVADAPKKGRRTKAQIEADKAAARERLEYNTAVSASQEAGAQHLHPMQDARPVVPAVEPVKDSEGENITIPVDFDDPSKGRRELDASKGEKVLGETTYTATEMNEIESANMWTPEFSEAKNSEFDGPESILFPPAGVKENTWVMAHYADTETGRAWWMSRAEAQINAHTMSQPEEAPF